MRSSIVAGLCVIASGCVIAEVTAERTQAALVAGPGTLQLTGTDTLKIVRIVAAPMVPGAVWQVAQQPDWLTIAPLQGELTTEGAALTIRSSPPDTLDPTTLAGDVRLTSTGLTDGVITVVLKHETFPNAQLNRSLIDFGQTIVTDSVLLTNSGRGNMYWSLSFAFPGAPAPFAFAQPSQNQGVLRTAQSIWIVFTVDRSRIPRGTFNADAIFSWGKLSAVLQSQLYLGLRITRP